MPVLQRLFIAMALGCACLVSAALAEQTTLLPNGDFETVADGKPAGWGLKGGATWEQEGNNHFLRLKSPEAGAEVMVYRAVPIPPDVKALELKYRVRFEQIIRGKQSWFDGRIMMNFRDAAGETVAPAPKPPSFKGTSAQWTEHSQQYRVPEGAVSLELMFTLFRAQGGQLDFDDVSLTPVPLETIIAAEKAAAEKEAARIAALPKPKPQVPVPAADKLPSELHVEGNRIVDASGNDVWLQGLAIPSLEWSAGGEHVLESVGVAIKDWHANVIRLPIREHFWAGHGPYQNDGGMKYRQLVDDAVNLCAGNGVYIVLDLHVFRAPMQVHADFWKEVAQRYKNRPAVLFELFNEPHDLSWEVWRNGGPVTDKKNADNTLVENKQKLKSFQSIGMQKLVDVVREQGAKNIVIAGGLDWSYDLSGILNGYALDDRGGDGIVYSSHVYPWKSDWQSKFVTAAEKYPLFLGEVGADTQRMDFVPADRQEDPATWVPDILGLIQQHKLNWTAWNFHPKSTPRVILDWNYTPTPFWGESVKRALAGEKFEMKKMR
jgi:aryl-phospho-beta-D-glucosidase BglC (GH1 family)